MLTVSHVRRPIELVISTTLPRLRRIAAPIETMRIAQAVGPDLMPRAAQRDERVVVGNAVASVLADVRRRRCAPTGLERCEESCRPAYRGAADWAGRPGAATRRTRRRRSSTYSTPHSASPGRAAGLKLRSPSGWMRVLSATRSSSRARAFEARVRPIGVGPFDQHAFARDWARRRDRRVVGE